MLARKVIKAKILELRRDKSIALEREYRSYQRYLQRGQDSPVSYDYCSSKINNSDG